jgi:hypothetical protein
MAHLSDSRSEPSLDLRNGTEAPILIIVRASMLVATAVRGAIPNANIAGTVRRDVLPVTTLTPLVTKNTAAKSRTCSPVILSLLIAKPAFYNWRCRSSESAESHLLANGLLRELG